MVVWTKAHTTHEEKAKMTRETRQVAWANEKADEQAKTGAIQDGAEVAERTAKEAHDTRKRCMRPSDMQPPSMMVWRSSLMLKMPAKKTNKTKPWWLYVFEEGEGRK